MRALNLFGSLPRLINENTAPWDWLGQLRLSIDPGLIRFVDLTGSGASIFDVALNRQWGTLVVTPIARADYESFARSGQLPELSFGFRFFMMDGTVAEAVQRFTVTVLDQDDTPPQALTLSTAGAVPYGVAGAVIGTLAVSDPDTAAGFAYTIQEDDAWLFQVVNGTLRLKPGMVLSEADGPIRSVTIDVSDGHQSSAFTVTFGVTDPRAPAGQQVNLLQAGRTKAGFSWGENGVLRGDVCSSDLAALRDHGSLMNIRLKDGQSIWVDQPRTIDLLDGRIFYTTEGRAALLWNVFETIGNRDPTLKQMQSAFDWVQAGGSDAVLMHMAVNAPQLKNLSNEELARRLYVNSVGWSSEDGVAYHKARLDAGLPREQLLSDFIEWRRGLGHETARAEQGIFVPRGMAHQVEVLLEIGAGMASGAATRWWVEMINNGTYGLGQLAWAVTTLDGFRQGMGALDPWSFTAEFYRSVLGAEMDPAGVRAWGDAIAKGLLGRSVFMEAVANGLNLSAFSQSYVFDRPDSPAFGADWF